MNPSLQTFDIHIQIALSWLTKAYDVPGFSISPVSILHRQNLDYSKRRISSLRTRTSFVSDSDRRIKRRSSHQCPWLTPLRCPSHVIYIVELKYRQGTQPQRDDIYSSAIIPWAESLLPYLYYLAKAHQFRFLFFVTQSFVCVNVLKTRKCDTTIPYFHQRDVCVQKAYDSTTNAALAISG